MSAPEEDSPVSEVAVHDEPQVALIEVEPGLAVVFGDNPPAGFDLIPFELMSTSTTETLNDKLAVASGLGNLAAQGVHGAMNAQGLVRLAPQTLKALETARPMAAGGWNLGSLVGSNGKIVSAIRWMPATGAQTATFVSSLGPAAVVLAMQLQLASISRRVDENVELTRDVLKALRQDQWTELVGLHESTLQAVDEARDVGVVNDHIFTPLRADRAKLTKQRRLFSSRLQGHIRELDTDVSRRRTYIQENAEEIIADTHGVLMAEGAWYRYRVLRAAHISNEQESLEENEKLLARIVSETRDEHTQMMEELTHLLRELERQFRVMAELPGQRSLPFISKRRNARDPIEMAQALAERVAQLRNRIHEVPAEPDPKLVVFEEAVPEKALSILRWAIPGEEPLLALADVKVDRLVGDDAYLGVTPERFFISRQSTLLKQGVIEQETPLSDIRYVRFREREKRGPILDIITRDENIRLTFDGWAESGESLAGAHRISEVLATAMNLPDTELRSDPLLRLESAEKKAIAR